MFAGVNVNNGKECVVKILKPGMLFFGFRGCCSGEEEDCEGS